MRCRSARILITQQLRETPAPEATAALSRHLARCSRCRAEQVALRAFAAQLAAGQPAPVPLPAPVAAQGWTERLLQSPPRLPVVRQIPLPWPWWAPIATAGLLFALWIAHSLPATHRHHDAARERGSRMASRVPAPTACPPPPTPGEGVLRCGPFLSSPSLSIGGGGQAVGARVHSMEPAAVPVRRVASPLSPFRANDDRAGRPDDLTALNDDPLVEDQRWTSLPTDEWQKIEARVRGVVRVRDDFVTIPFPRLASTSNRQIAEVVASYKREAAIVDPRLSHEVTCAFKGTALSDLCSQLRAETGIQLTAGSSVADDKVTVFCEKLPLRDVMRQLSRPFGYTWLRSGKVLSAGYWVSGKDADPNTQHPTPNTQYRYELVQDLRSQLLEEELRNRSRDAALLDLEREIDRYRPYLGLTPDEALARSKTAAPEERKLLEDFAGWGWGPLQLYARLSPQEQAALRAGRTISFSGDPQRIARDGAQPLPPELERGVLQSMREVRIRRPGTSPENKPAIGTARDLPDGVAPASSPEANGIVSLRIGHSELGQFTLDGGSGVTVGSLITIRGHDLATGVSPAVQDPKNGIANARLTHDPALQGRVTVQPGQDLTPATRFAGTRPSLRGKGESRGATSDHDSVGLRLPSPSRGGAGGGVESEPKVTSADVLEALHRASGMPIVADYYTHLYPRASVSVKDQPLFEALNHLADAMYLHWSKDGSWLQFRSVSFYDDRVKEVPNRLLARWAAARRQSAHSAGTRGLPLDDLIEMAQLSDAQLDSSFVTEGVKELWGLEEWGLARNHEGRPHLRYLAQLTPAQRQMAVNARGLPFSELSLAQQQQFIAHLGSRLESLEEVAGATVRVEYSQPGSFRWPAGSGLPPPGQTELFGLSLVREPTRAETLSAARRLDASASETQIAPTDLSLAVVYTLTDPRTGKTRELGVRATSDGSARISW